MIDLEQTVIRKWAYKSRAHFESLGYQFTNWGEEFEVAVKDLPEHATDDVVVYCDYCGKKLSVRYERYNKNIKKYGNYSCQHCQQKRSLEKRQDEMYSKILKFCKDHNYELITKKEEILSRETYVTYICPIHGQYTTQVTNILQGKLCYKCSRKQAGINRWKYGISERIKTYYQMALQKCAELGYKLLSKENDIISYDAYVKYACPIHGEHEMKFGNLIMGRHCPDCGHPKSLKIKDTTSKHRIPQNKLSIDEIISRIEKCGGVVLNPEDYKNQHERNLQILCPRCGKPFTTSLVLFTQHGGQVCKECYRKESIGERRIRKYLEKHSIKHDPEHWFPDCRDINPLPFDFYLYEINTIIEFDGKQHFSDTQFFHNSYDFKKTQKHDEIKNKYCEDNDIRLIRIPYWEIDKIEEILDKELNYSHEDIV